MPKKALSAEVQARVAKYEGGRDDSDDEGAFAQEAKHADDMQRAARDAMSAAFSGCSDALRECPGVDDSLSGASACVSALGESTMQQIL